MEVGADDDIKLRVAFALNQLLAERKRALSAGKETTYSISNVTRLADETYFRRATISSIFNGDSAPSIITFVKLLRALNCTFKDFDAVYETATDQDLENFQQLVTKRREKATKRKG